MKKVYGSFTKDEEFGYEHFVGCDRKLNDNCRAYYVLTEEEVARVNAEAERRERLEVWCRMFRIVWERDSLNGDKWQEELNHLMSRLEDLMPRAEVKKKEGE